MATKENKNPSASLDKKREVFVLSQVVFNGAQPKDILEKRRALESKENWTLDYRLDNYYPVQVSLFRRAINDYLEVLNKADIQINTTSTAMQKFLEDKKFFANNRYFSVQDWLFNYISVERQKDPNAVLVPIVNFDFPKRFDNGFNNDPKGAVKNGIPFFDKSNKSPEVDILYFNFDKVVTNTENALKVTAGSWVYAVEDGKDLSQDFYIEADKQFFYLTIPVKNDGRDPKQTDEVIYIKYPYYPHQLKQTPYVSVGGASMCEYLEGGTPVEYNVSDYYGAIAFACYMMATMSDKQVIEARNNFPIKYRYQAKCQAHDCDGGWCNGAKPEDPKTKCKLCDGTGWQKDTNPFGDFIYESGSFLDEQGKTLAQPVNYVVPPVESLRFIAENFKEYMTYVANELCVTQEQNMTNQAAEAKRYDLMNKITLVTFIVEDVLRVCETILKFVESLLESSDPTLIIKKPQSWDIKNNEDILFQISQAKTNGSPQYVIRQLVRELLYLDLKEHPQGKFIVDFLMKKDKLITYGNSDLKEARIIFGADITERQMIIHTNGIDIIMELIDRGVKEANFDAEFEKEVLTYKDSSPEIPETGSSNVTPNGG